jgi:mannosylglycerate hydrolase
MKSDSGKKKTAYIVSHTHWDREWRYPIWETRLMLLDFMDELIEVLQSGKYPAFLMDGQISPVLDYLEIRPEKLDEVKELVSQGKLEIGPWLTLPDEYPVDGEALVRNLLLGNRKAGALGRVFNAGYTSFGWGQTAQLPQIYAGFGIDVAMVGKRVSNKRAPQSEFIWEAPDGSQLLATRFGEWGRQNFYFKVHLSALFNTHHEGPGWKYQWDKGGLAYHRAEPDKMEQDHFQLQAPQKWYPEFIDQKLLEIAWSTTDQSVLPEDRLMMNGCDYTSVQPMFEQMLSRIKDLDCDKSRQWIHTSMSEFVKVMRNKIDKSKLVTVHGELRDGPACAVTGNALATRLYLKQLNCKAQNLLIRYAEPLSMLVSMLGVKSETALLNKAWMYLLNSHPHDSINGVTQDKTANDVEYRLNQVIEISESLGNRAMQNLIRQIDTSSFDKKDVLIAVFNPLPYPRREILEAYINMPYEECFDYFIAPPDGLLISDSDGSTVSTQYNGHSDQNYCVAEIHARAFPYKCTRNRIFFDTGEIPAGGYKIFKAEKFDQTKASIACWSNSQAMTDNIVKSPLEMENEYLKVTINSEGTIDINDKLSGKTYTGMNYYSDRGEAGNYWINDRPMYDKTFCTPGCPAEIRTETEGPLCGSIVAKVSVNLPADSDKTRRSRHRKPLEITTRYSLKKGKRQVDVNVTFENHCENHYLKVHFPTDLKGATHADAGGHFIVNRRSVTPSGPDEHSYWPDMNTLPQKSFVDLSDANFGLAVINDSLTEYEVLDDSRKTLSLSLLRSVKNWICTEIRAGSNFPSQKGGQCKGTHEYSYSIVPHEGNWQKAGIDFQAQLFNVPCRIVQTSTNKGRLNDTCSLFSIDNSAVRFSALKKCHDRNTYILRLYNPSGESQTSRISFFAGLESAWLCNLNEQRAQQVEVENNSITVELSKYKIKTIELQSNGKSGAEHERS